MFGLEVAKKMVVSVWNDMNKARLEHDGAPLRKTRIFDVLWRKAFVSGIEGTFPIRCLCGILTCEFAIKIKHSKSDIIDIKEGC